ncbi:MAG: hypothetical protein PHS86_12065, partial [Syntrophaceae bacterium]|nr:hypothetical protein [Syntrophaceae bacterium]
MAKKYETLLNKLKMFEGWSDLDYEDLVRTARSWKSAQRRCNQKENPAYHYYGGRGITFCDNWLNFEVFVMNMGIRPLGTTLDRIDVNGNYEPGNCRWATRTEQQRNRRDSRRINVNGELKHI